IKLSQSDSEVLFGKTTQEHTFDDTADTTTSSVNWKVSVDKLAIEKTNFWFKDDNQARTKGIDYFNLKLTDIAGALDELYYSADSISGDLKGFTVKDHSGFDLKMLKGDFVYTNTGATIKDLLLETPNTLIQDEIIISYPSLDAVSNNPATMSINANIKKSHINMKDIRLLAPDLEKEEVMKPLMNKRFYIDGKVMGKLNDLRIPRFEFKTLNNTHVIATAHIKGLPDVDKMYLDLNLKKMVTGRNDLNQLIAPSLLPDSIQLPRNISLTGTFKGGINGFDTDMKLITEQGNATVNGKLSMGRDTTYNAFVTVDNFNLGEFLKQDSVLGYISAQAQVNGTGLNPKTMQADILGTLNRFDAMGYSYKDIEFDLTARSGDIAGSINSPDPNIDLNANIQADMRGEFPRLYAE